MIDVFYKIRSLHEAGVEITLHCFQYGDRQASAELNKYSKKVYYYQRKTGFAGLHPTLPYIVSSRNDKQLLQNLLTDDAAILFEGIHSTYWLQHPALNHRIKILRAHNIESDYYRALAGNTNSLSKKIYYYLESNRLLMYENNLKNVSHILAISVADEKYLSHKYPQTPIHYIPAFHAVKSVTSKAGKGLYCLYHGNLSVAENIQSVMFLANEVFKDLKIQLIIAGKNPAPVIKNLATDHIKVIENPSGAEMESLIQNAHIHALPVFQNTGIKLKLLHSLFAGRFCISNDPSIGQLLRSNVLMADTAEEFRSKVIQTMNFEFTADEIEKRNILFQEFRNENGAQRIIELLG